MTVRLALPPYPAPSGVGEDRETVHITVIDLRTSDFIIWSLWEGQDALLHSWSEEGRIGCSEQIKTEHELTGTYPR